MKQINQESHQIYEFMNIRIRSSSGSGVTFVSESLICKVGITVNIQIIFPSHKKPNLDRYIVEKLYQKKGPSNNVSPEN